MKFNSLGFLPLFFVEANYFGLRVRVVLIIGSTKIEYSQIIKIYLLLFLFLTLR